MYKNIEQVHSHAEILFYALRQMKTDVCIDIKEFFEKTWTICIDEYELGSFDVFKM